jgi:aspartate-semialdehyde dehydrogenase
MGVESKIKTGILGATGAVGQRFVQLLQGHPWFELTALAASSRSAGGTYGEVCNWKVSEGMPESVRDWTIAPCEPGLDCRLLFSALPAEVAGDIEEDFARAGYWVFSNSRNHRMDPDVPLLIPEVNPDHVAILPHQQRNRGWGEGFIVTNPNCSTIGVTLALKPLQDAFGLERVVVNTLQALSGAGYPGLPSLDMVDNVIPHIGGEEDKVETEPAKILGELKGNSFVDASFRTSAHCNRVAVLDGHLECVSVQLGRQASLEEVLAAFRDFRAEPQDMDLPGAPNPPIILRDEDDRPQPRYDRDAGKGMAASVGRVRECPVFDYKFVVLSHNTIRGAAGASILNAELLKAKGYLSG